MINKNNYSDAEIYDSLHIKDGSRSVSFRYDLLNKNEKKLGELNVARCTVSFGENRAIMRSALFEILDGARDINFYEDLIQPWFVLKMRNGPGRGWNPALNRSPDSKTPLLGHASGGTVEWPLGLFFPGSPRKTVTETGNSSIIGAYDKTIVLEEDRFTQRFYIAAGNNCVDIVQRILATSGINYSQIAQSPAVFASDTEYATGVKKRDAVNEILRSINYTPIYADENGVLTSMSYQPPGERPVSHSYSSRNGVLHPEFKVSRETAGVANVFTRVALNVDKQELTATYANNDPQSPVSTVRRGRKIVDFERISRIDTQELLNAYVKRTAVEKTAAQSLLTFNTVLMPGHGCFQTLFLDIPEVLDAPAKFMETGWEMELSYDGIMRHEARRIVKI